MSRFSGRRPDRETDAEPPSPAALRAAALRLLGRREYTTTELRQKLVDRGGPDDVVEGVVSRLVDENLVSDRRAAASHVRTAARVKLRGRARIARELRARGLSEALSEEVLAAVPRDAEVDTISAILAKKRLPANPSQAERRRIFMHLLRRGFSADTIAQAIKLRDEP